MEGDEITWKIIPNAVESRMIDHSLVHKLIPSRRLSRKNKAMNLAIKQFHSLKSYSQYVKMKTSILRNLSTNSDTDDNVSFSDDDYSILYKSNLSLTNYVTNMSNKNRKHWYEIDLETNEKNMSDEESKEIFTQKPKNMSSTNINLSRPKIVKKRIKSNTFSVKKKTKNSFIHNSICPKVIDDNVEILDNKNYFPKTSKENVLNLVNKGFNSYNGEEATELGAKANVNSNKIAYKTATVQEIVNNNNESEQLNSMTDEINERFQMNENHHYEILSNSKTKILKRVKKNLQSALDNVDDVQNVNDSCNGAELLLHRNHSNKLEQNETIKRTSAENIKNEECLKNQSSRVNKKHQPKDSGIEEDTEEEFSRCDRKHKKLKNKVQKTKQNIPTTSFLNNNDLTDFNIELKSESCSISSKSDSKDIIQGVNESININKGEQEEKITDNSESQNCMLSKSDSEDIILGVNENINIIKEEQEEKMTDFDDNLKSKGYNMPSESGFKGTLGINENIDINAERHKEKMQNYKLQPKITHTEISTTRFKIISDTSVFNKDVEQKELNMTDFCDRRIDEIEEIDQSMENGISPTTTKRLQQLRRLNLSIDSESSLSENDNTYCNIDNMRSKLFKRSKESSDISESDNESINFKHEISVQIDNKSRKNKKISKHKNLLSRTTYCLNSEDILKPSLKQIKENSFADVKQLSFTSNKPSYSKGATGHYLKESNEKNLENDTIITDKEQIIRARSCNLQELIEEENLVIEEATPSFVFKDTEDDELFIMDIPSVVFDNQLLGNKIVLTNKKLKLGKQKYKVEYKNIDSTSFVLATGKSHKPYKTVNIKPVTRVVTREKITR